MPQAYYRGARAALKLGDHQRAADICSKGLAMDQSAAELQQLRSQAEAQLQAARAVRQREAARAMAERAPAKKLASVLLQKGYQVGRPQLSVGECPSFAFVVLVLGRAFMSSSTSSRAVPR